MASTSEVYHRPHCKDMLYLYRECSVPNKLMLSVLYLLNLSCLFCCKFREGENQSMVLSCPQQHSQRFTTLNLILESLTELLSKISCDNLQCLSHCLLTYPAFHSCRSRQGQDNRMKGSCPQPYSWRLDPLCQDAN